MKNLGGFEALHKPTNAGGYWKRFDLNTATKVDPNAIDDGCVDTGGRDGYTTLKVNSGIDSRLLQNGVLFYKQLTDITCEDLAVMGIDIEIMDATPGAYGTAAADNLYIAAGFCSDPANIATRCVALGYEHGSSVDPRCYHEQGGVQAFGGPLASGRWVSGYFLKGRGNVKRFNGAVFTDLSYNPVGGQVNSTSILSSASATDPLYVFLFAGRGAAGSWQENVRMFYTYSRGRV